MDSPRCSNPGCGQPLPVTLDGVGSCIGCSAGTLLSGAPSLRAFHGAGEASWVEIDLPRTAADTVVETHPVVVLGAQPDRMGRFLLRRLLGEGVFGRVYLAYDPHLDREVALKVAKPEHLASPERRERFFREARAAANLRHPHIVPLFEMGQDGPHAYLASAFIQGRTLEEALRAAPGGRLEPRLAAEIVLHLAEALEYAHTQHIVHRDVKPANILLEGIDPAAPPVPLLMDFGLAARAVGESRLTQAGTILGTPLYMAPESCSGTSGAVQPASDQYSLGVVLYELLTGRTPFAGPIQAVLVQQQTREPLPPRQLCPRLPRDLETIVLKTLAKDPRRRYASCQDLADDLRRFLVGDPIHARRMSVAERLWRGACANPALAIVSLLFVAFLVAGLVLVSHLYLQADRDRARAEALLDGRSARFANLAHAPPEVLVELAAEAVRAGDADPTLRAPLHALAIAALTQAVRRGLDDRARWRAEPRWHPLHANPDFRALLDG